MKHWILVGLTAVALSGCATQLKDAVARCDATHPPVIGNYAARAACINEANRDYGRRGDGEELIRTVRYALAQRVDAGQISASDMEVAVAQMTFQVRQQEAQQDAAQSAAVSASLAATAAAIQVMQPQQPAYVQPWSATCSQQGFFTRCSGN